LLIMATKKGDSLQSMSVVITYFWVNPQIHFFSSKTKKEVIFERNPKKI
jgi:hypothetical protein